MARLKPFTCALLLAMAGIAWLAAPVRPQTSDADLALVLAIDCSFSVDAAEYRLQMQGLGQALQDPELLQAIRKNPNQQIVLMAFQWSDKNNQKIILPWTKLASAEDLQMAGELLSAKPRQLAHGGTSITNALLFADIQMQAAPPATRRAIDLSTDGRNNSGPPVPIMRDTIISRGITINALVIANEVPTLDLYAERQIVGGPDHFVVKAATYQDYHEAILRKLLREVTAPGMT